jgi:hypothetical protein
VGTGRRPGIAHLTPALSAPLTDLLDRRSAHGSYAEDRPSRLMPSKPCAVRFAAPQQPLRRQEQRDLPIHHALFSLGCLQSRDSL